MSTTTTATPSAPRRFTNKLAAQNVLIIGGTGGIGLTLAQALLEFGATVILSSSRQAKVDSCIASLQQDLPATDKSRVLGFTCDLASPEVEANLTHLFQQFGPNLPLDHIIYMAGDRLPTVPLSDVTLPLMQQVFQVRTFSALLAVKIGHTHLRSQTRACSITLTSGSISERPMAGGWCMLAPVGTGLCGLARQLAFDLAPIRVNAVAPGVIATDLWDAIGDKDAVDAYLRSHEAKMPTREVGQPEDLAEAYVYLLRDKNVTGSVVHSNSGAFLV